MALKETNAVVAPIGAPAKQGKKLPAQLISISDKVLTLDNDKKTPYRACSIVLDADDTNEIFSAMIWETSFQKGIELGSCRVEYRVENGNVYMTVLGNGANRISLAKLMALTEDADLEGGIL